MKGYAAQKGQRGFRTRAGYRTIGDEIQALIDRPSPASPPPYAMQVWISPDLAVRLKEEAERRGIGAPELARQLLDAIIDDNMYAAILDE